MDSYAFASGPWDGIFLLPVNLYGPRDDFDLETGHVIPAMTRKFVSARDEGVSVVLWGDGSPTREFLYVEDAARARRRRHRTLRRRGSREPR